jgi:hypothetical protein
MEGELREPVGSRGRASGVAGLPLMFQYESEDQIPFIVISFSFGESVVPKEFQENLKKVLTRFCVFS